MTRLLDQTLPRNEGCSSIGQHQRKCPSHSQWPRHHAPCARMATAMQQISDHCGEQGTRDAHHRHQGKKSLEETKETGVSNSMPPVLHSLGAAFENAVLSALHNSREKNGGRSTLHALHSISFLRNKSFCSHREKLDWCMN